MTHVRSRPVATYAAATKYPDAHFFDCGSPQMENADREIRTDITTGSGRDRSRTLYEQSGIDSMEIDDRAAIGNLCVDNLR